MRRSGPGQIGGLTGHLPGKFRKLAEIYVEMTGILLYNIEDSDWGIASSLV